MNDNYVIGVDFGSDSVRAMMADVRSCRTLATAQFAYPRWQRQLYCNPEKSIFRQHPLDYIEGLQSVVTQVIRQVPGSGNLVRAVSIDTTGSTPVAVNAEGMPLALLPQFSENPDAMFILWKDHSAVEEAKVLNTMAHDAPVDYTSFSGGIYSAEWFWAKALHILLSDADIARNTVSFVEHSDWMPALLCGKTMPSELPRNRCAAGHKAMWHASWGGFPKPEFFLPLSPQLAEIAAGMPSRTCTSDMPVGHLNAYWAHTLGLNEDVLVGVGMLDAHMGAIGGEIRPGCLTKVMGTSTCDMLVYDGDYATPVPGICGQVDGSVIPGMTGFEAGQSAFGDVFAWFKDIVLWSSKLFGKEKSDGEKKIFEQLAAEAAADTTDIVANDWLNGRRTPFADQTVSAAVSGLTLGTTAPQLYRAFVEAAAFGSKAILEHLRKNGCSVNEVSALGGVAQKSPFVMQIMADVMQLPIKVVRAQEACSLGACMTASVVAGLHPDIITAQKVMGQGFEKVYLPDTAMADYYRTKYEKYRAICRLVDPDCVL